MKVVFWIFTALTALVIIWLSVEASRKKHSTECGCQKK